MLVDAGENRIEVTVDGDGAPVVLVPSLGRGPEDFADLAARLVANGYRVVLPSPRGIGDSRGPLENLTLHDCAADVAAVIEAVGGPATVVGHAFGNRVARMLATDQPELVRGVVLLACGGKAPMPPDVLRALRRCFQMDLPDSERLEAIGQAFFAAGNDPAPWLDGWYPEVARSQAAASQATDVDAWWAAGAAPILVVHGREDAAAPRENVDQLRAVAGDRMTLVELDRAGHALLPERPDAIADAILDFLRRGEA